MNKRVHIKGVTLIEVLVASLVAITVFVGAGYLIVRSQKIAIQTAQYSMLTEVAQFYITTTEYQFYYEKEAGMKLPYGNAALDEGLYQWNVFVDWDEENDNANFADVSLNREQRKIVIDYDMDNEWDRQLILQEQIEPVFDDNDVEIGKEDTITVIDPSSSPEDRISVTLSLMLYKDFETYSLND